MFLAIDVGNTTLHLGLFADDDQPVWQARIAPRQADRDLAAAAASIPGPVTRAALASVNPRHTELFLAAKPAGWPAPKFIPADWPVPVRNLTERPADVGIDRLLNAYAGFRLTRRPTIVIDFGTALTFDVTDGEGAYLGGIIAPGLRTSIQALHSVTALLPEIELQPQARVLGRNTFQAMTAGYYHGYQGMVRHLIDALNRERGVTHELLFTGGDAALIATAMDMAGAIRPALTLQAMHHVARHHG